MGTITICIGFGLKQINFSINTGLAQSCMLHISTASTLPAIRVLQQVIPDNYNFVRAYIVICSTINNYQSLKL